MISICCLDCGQPIDIQARVKTGQKVTCPHCQVELEIINVEPLELDWVYNGPAISFKGMSIIDEDWWMPSP